MTNSRRCLLRISLMIVARSLTTVWSCGDAHDVRLRDSLPLFVHLTCLLLFHSHHWPVPQWLSSKSVQNQMPIDTYNNSTILIVQLSDGGGGNGGPLICQGGGPPAPTWSRHWLLSIAYPGIDDVQIPGISGLKYCTLNQSWLLTTKSHFC